MRLGIPEKIDLKTMGETLGHILRPVTTKTDRSVIKDVLDICHELKSLAPELLIPHQEKITQLQVHTQGTYMTLQEAKPDENPYLSVGDQNEGPEVDRTLKPVTALSSKPFWKQVAGPSATPMLGDALNAIEQESSFGTRLDPGVPTNFTVGMIEYTVLNINNDKAIKMSQLENGKIIFRKSSSQPDMVTAVYPEVDPSTNAVVWVNTRFPLSTLDFPTQGLETLLAKNNAFQKLVLAGRVKLA
jgi:hypothetical protein